MVRQRLPQRGISWALAALWALAGAWAPAVTAVAAAGPTPATGSAAGVASAAPGATTASAAAGRGGPVLVFAAASLAEAVEEVDAAFSASTGVPVKASFAASSLLARQIEAGAPADVFFAADREWMDYLDGRGLLKAGSRRDLLGNALVLIAPADSTLQLKITPGFDLRGALRGGRLATGDPDSVPVGQYARAALTKLGVWERVSDRLVRAENVRAALAYVARGQAPLGIVYQTDAQAEKRVRVVGVFPADTHPPITYPLALTARARAQAGRYAEFLAGDVARQIFVRRGFVPLTAAQSARTR
jgi:molybdate transport system substrate-binding protein